MDLFTYLLTIRIHLVETHARVLNWFNSTDDLKSYRPKDGGWTVSEILEHIGLT